jgi:hypothetical protein
METELNNKFYVPGISEFYVGFECERDWRKIDPNGAEHPSWEKCIVEPSLWSSNQMWLATMRNDCSEFRVKYLDKEDIESLGWDYQYIKPDEDEYPDEDLILGYDKTIEYSDENCNGGKWYRMYQSKDNRWIIEYWYSKNSVTDIGTSLFKGNIKNKCELIKLLKQIGING